MNKKDQQAWKAQRRDVHYVAVAATHKPKGRRHHFALVLVRAGSSSKGAPAVMLVRVTPTVNVRDPMTWSPASTQFLGQQPSIERARHWAEGFIAGKWGGFRG